MRDAESKPPESSDPFRAAFEASPVAIVITRQHDGVYVDVNPAAQAMFGYTRDEVVGQSALALNLWVSNRDRDAIIESLKRDGEVNRREIRVRHKDGHELLCSASVRPLMLGGVSHLLFISEDVTRRRALEAQVLQSQKLEAVGRLAGGVAHDFNNLLTVVMGAVLELRMEAALSPAGRAAADEIGHAAERASALTRQLLAFSRKHVVQPEVLELNAVVSKLTLMLRRLIGEDVALQVSLHPHAGCVRMDSGELEQVVINLAVNARDAMARGGTLSITTRPALDEAGRAAPGVSLLVRDTGCGMSGDVKARLFEPFFTTKPPSRGTGLGLATVYGIVHQAGGRISVQSVVDEGSTFEVWLPSVAGAAAAPAASADALVRGSGTVLVVEDEPSLRALCARTLRLAGYTVLEAANGDEALAVSEKSQAALTALVADVVMPGMSGIALSLRLRARQPNLRVLYMSGYTHQTEFPPDDGSWSFLQKPFDPVTFTRVLRALVDRRE